MACPQQHTAFAVLLPDLGVANVAAEVLGVVAVAQEHLLVPHAQLPGVASVHAFGQAGNGVLLTAGVDIVEVLGAVAGHGIHYVARVVDAQEVLAGVSCAGLHDGGPAEHPVPVLGD